MYWCSKIFYVLSVTLSFTDFDFKIKINTRNIKAQLRYRKHVSKQTSTEKGLFACPHKEEQLV